MLDGNCYLIKDIPMTTVVPDPEEMFYIHSEGYKGQSLEGWLAY